MTPNHKFSSHVGRDRSAGIVIREQEILLMHRRRAGVEYWVIPGGGVELNESPKQAVVRELAEETTLVVTPTRLLYHYIYELPGEKSYSQYYFLCGSIGGDTNSEPVLGDSPEKDRMETEDNWYRPEWVPIARLSDLQLYPPELKSKLIEDLRSGWAKDVYQTTLHLDLRQNSV